MIFEKIDKYRKNPLYKNSFYLMLNNILNSIIGFFFWIIVARLYNITDFGLVVAIISFSSIISILSLMGVDYSIVRFLATEKNRNSFINTCITSVLIITLLLSVVSLLIMNIIDPKLEIINSSFVLLLLFISYNVLTNLFTVITYIFIALRDTKYCLASTLSSSLIKFPIVIVLVPFAELGIFGSCTFSLIFACVVGFIFIKKVCNHYVPNVALDRDIISRIFNFSIGNYIVGILISIPPSIIPLIILNQLGPAENAYYYVAFSIASVLFMVSMSTSASFLAEGSFNEKNILENLKKTIKTSYSILLPSVILLILFGNDVLELFGKGYMSNSSNLLTILALSSLLIAIYHIYTTFLRIMLRIKELVIIVAINSMALILLSASLIQNFDIMGVGIAYLVVYGMLDVYILLRFYILK